MALYCSKRLPELLSGITSKHHGDFCCLNCPHYLRTENKLESHKTVCQNNNLCNTVMPSGDTNILEFNQ